MRNMSLCRIECIANFCRLAGNHVVSKRGGIITNPRSLLCRLISSQRVHRSFSSHQRALQSKSRYVYDPKTDSFLPKEQFGFKNTSQEDGKQNYENMDDTGKRDFIPFLKRFSKNLFLITGGIIWGSIIFIALFVDVKESTELVLQIKDSEEEVRLFAFYDIAENKNDLANILSKDKRYESDEIDVVVRMKELALYNALGQIKNQNIIVETLGKPVQLSGFRAAAKLDRMVHNFQNLTKFGVPKYDIEDKSKYRWTAECLIEGPKGVASLILDFERPESENNWILSKVTVEKLEKSGSVLLDLAAPLPDGVKLID